eukprot:2240083-Heterocapsa_arctica.AAC.1
MNKKTSDVCTQVLRDFIGPENCMVFSSDHAPELIKAAQTLSLPHATSTPYCSQSNGRIENAIGQVLRGSRALLEQSGLPVTWWPWGAPY